MIHSVWLLAITMILTGCRHHNAITFVTNTQFGAKVGVNAEKIPEIQVGYNRQEAARVPVYLMTTKDELSASPPTINALLHQAAQQLTAAKTTPWGQANVDNVKVAQRLIDEAIEMDLKTTNKQGSSLLQQIKVAAAKLSVNPNSANAAPSADLEFIAQLMHAEMAKPRFYAEFQEQAKFVGSRTGNDARDAYSVLGTFSGNMDSGSTSGSGPEAKMRGGLAQYFATGIAAQLLAEKGGAALVSTAPTATPPGEIDAKQVERIKKEIERVVADSETVANYVWKNTAAGAAPTVAERKTSLAKAFQGIKAATDALDYYANLPDKAAVKSNLENSFPNELATMVSNINKN